MTGDDGEKSPSIHECSLCGSAEPEKSDAEEGKQGERRPVDHVDEAVGIAGEAAELAEHIRDTDPQYRRDELLDHLIEMIDDAHEQALEASVRWHDGE